MTAGTFFGRKSVLAEGQVFRTHASTDGSSKLLFWQCSANQPKLLFTIESLSRNPGNRRTIFNVRNSKKAFVRQQFITELKNCFMSSKDL